MKSRLVDCIVLTLWAIILVCSGKDVVRIYGGSMIFMPITGGLMAISYIYKKFQNEISLFSVLILLLVLVNYLNYHEYKGDVDFLSIIIYYNILIFAFITVFNMLGIMFFATNDNSNNDIFMLVRSRIQERLLVFLLIGFILFCIGGSIPYLHDIDKIIIDNYFS